MNTFKIDSIISLIKHIFNVMYYNVMCNNNVMYYIMYYIIKYGLDERLILEYNILNLGETKNGQGYVGVDQMLFRFKIPAVHIVRTLNTEAPPNLPVVRKWRPLTECI